MKIFSKILLMILTLNLSCTAENQTIEEIKIGKKIWSAKNLDISHYRNGDQIKQASSYEEWIKAGENEEGAWCYYENEAENGKIYGKLYNWYAVSDPRGLAPEGWHIPTDREWEKLISFSGDGYNHSGIFKSTGTIENSDGFWQSPNEGATNRTGFSALPGGFRSDNGEFKDLGNQAVFYSSSDYNAHKALIHAFSTNNEMIVPLKQSKMMGFSVRLIKSDDNTIINNNERLIDTVVTNKEIELFLITSFKVMDNSDPILKNLKIALVDTIDKYNISISSEKIHSGTDKQYVKIDKKDNQSIEFCLTDEFNIINLTLIKTNEESIKIQGKVKCFGDCKKFNKMSNKRFFKIILKNISDIDEGLSFWFDTYSHE